MYIIESNLNHDTFWDCNRQDFGLLEYADVFPTIEAAKAVLSEIKWEGFFRALEADEEIFFDNDEIGLKGGAGEQI
jgi:hypothetical protein